MLTITPVANQNRNSFSLNFGAFLPRKTFKDIRDIPHMPCGCCGRDMFTSDEVRTLIKGFQAGSKRALENDAMAEYRGYEAFSFIESLSAVDPKATISDLISIPINADRIKSFSPQTQLNVNAIAQISDGITVKAPRVMKKLEKYRDFFSPEDEEILKVMDFYALKYPKKTFSEIFNLPEVAEHHQKIYELNKQEAKTRRVEVFQRLKEFGKKLSPADQKALQQANKTAKSILKTPYYQAHIKRELLNDLYEDFVKNSEGNFRKKTVFKMVDDFIVTGMTPDEFIVNHVNTAGTDKDIVSHFVKRLQATYEHLKARSKEGTDNQENIIILCGKCNSERADLAYPFFLRFHPEMSDNLQKQLNKIMTLIKHRKLIGYNDYPMKMKQNVLGESDALIRPKIGDYLKFREERAAESLEKSQARLAKDEARINTLDSKIEGINAKIRAIEEQLKQLKQKQTKLRDERKVAKSEKDKTEDYIKNKTQNLKEKQDNIAQDRETNESLRYKRRKFKKLRD